MLHKTRRAGGENLTTPQIWVNSHFGPMLSKEKAARDSFPGKPRDEGV